ncbi:alkaline phosphatase family protein [Candidatus Binatia bacterium]|nr:alkaline phosphatase family protein [Candidatus Binatia bacterium]
MKPAARLAAALALTVVCAPLARAQEAPPDCSFAAGDLPATTNPGGLHGAQIPIDTIVVLMQENRSFDHYFSRLSGDVDRPKADASNPNPLGGAPIKRFHQKKLCETAGDLSHSWNGSHNEWNNGAMDGFTTVNANSADPTGSRTMGYYTARDLPFYYSLYRTFAISDRHFCSLLGPTYPNRYYLLTGTSFGHINNAFPNFGAGEWTQPTIFEQLDAAGVTWTLYYSDLPFALLFGYGRDHSATNFKPIAQYFTDAAAGTLPQVTFVDPAFLEGEDENDEHPPSNVQKGQEFTSRIVGALMSSPQWSRSALFITYDEHGGYWDHVPPPLACAPDAIGPIGGSTWGFDRYGVRVPFVVVSPYAKRHYVSHTVTDQTSVLRFIQTRHDLPALTARDANADPLLEMFDFANPPFVKPPKLKPAKIDAKRALDCP